MSSISMTDARKMIIACYNKNEPLFLIGKPGMGKSALFESVATELGIGFIDFRLTMRDAVDVGGMRVPDVSGKSPILKHFLPEDLPDAKRHGPKGLMVFDEINAVGPMMQATSYGIIEERRNGSYRMPDGWTPMASGNNMTDKAAAQRISSALANRFNVQIVEPDLSSWLDQYGMQNVDTRGCAFLKFRPALFHVMPKADQIAFPSARSWTKAFKFIDETPSFRRKLFAGYVGEEAADEFEAFWRIMETIVTIEQIEADPKGAPTPATTDPGTCFAMAGMLARVITRKNIDKVMVYVNRLLPDYQVNIVRDATKLEPTLTNTAAYGAWAVKHADLLA